MEKDDFSLCSYLLPFVLRLILLSFLFCYFNLISVSKHTHTVYATDRHHLSLIVDLYG